MKPSIHKVVGKRVCKMRYENQVPPSFLLNGAVELKVNDYTSFQGASMQLTSYVRLQQQQQQRRCQLSMSSVNLMSIKCQSQM